MTQQQPPTSQERRNATRRSKHPYHMYDAIQRQPQAMAEMLTKHADRVTKVAATIKGKRRLYLVGIGTSWHAALVGEYWFRRMAPNSLEVQAWHSFEFHSYPPKVGPDDAVLVISHRGTKTYSFLALEQAKAAGAYTISITSNQPGQRIQVADDVLNTVDAEVSAAFTISYTSALMVLGMLASALTEEGSDRAAANAGLAKVPEVAGRVLSGGDSIREAADRFQDRKRFICVAAGPNTANAYEVALKMKETSRADSEGFHVEQLLHGPFCEVDGHCLVTLVAPPGPGYYRALDVARASAAVEAPVWALVQEGDTRLSAEATEAYHLSAVEELWSPLTYVLPLQLFTYYLSLARGTQPDLFQQDNAKQAAAKTHYDL